VASAAAAAAVAIGQRKIEAIVEKAPRQTCGVQQIADVFARHVHQCAAGIGAYIVGRVSIADKRVSAMPIRNHVGLRVAIIHHPLV
jgi:cytochrome c1